jgi:hypothetical protein
MIAYIIGYYDSFEKDGVLMIGKPFYNWSLMTALKKMEFL